jgi:predicted Zn-dependent peptidase
MRDTHVFVLDNGIRVGHLPVPASEIVHCGIFLEVGSRDETTRNQGIAHFWEHMAFKGTRKRNAFRITNSLDAIGGELNAYTEKEKVVFYASVRRQFAEKAVDILTDICFHSTFPSHEIEKERGVILEEMAMYRDDPEDSIQDEFESVVFRNHPMGMNILGTEETVRSFHRKDFTSFIHQHLDTKRIAFACVGNLSHKEVQSLSAKFFERVRSRRRAVKRKGFRTYQSNEKILHREVKQARCVIGRDAYPIGHKDRIPYYMLVNYLGGPGLNSRLNYLLREKRGMVYSVDAQYIPYSDTGLFGIYFGTEPKQLNRCIQIIEKELVRMADEGIGVRHLNALKEQLKGHMALSEENNLSLLLMVGRSLLDFGRVPSLEEVYQKIDDTTAVQMQNLARVQFKPGDLSYLIMEPLNGSNDRS